MLTLGRTIMSRRVNESGLTFREWCDSAACVTPSVAEAAAWEHGEDPTEYRDENLAKTRVGVV